MSAGAYVPPQTLMMWRGGSGAHSSSGFNHGSPLDPACAQTRLPEIQQFHQGCASMVPMQNHPAQALSIPSHPVCVAHLGDSWTMPSNPSSVAIAL